MGGFFDRFKDFDSLKEKAEQLYQDSAKETKRQAELLKLRGRVLNLERRMNAEFRVLGERVWDLHESGALQPENLTGAFDLLEALAKEIDEAQADIELLSKPEPEPEDEAAEESAPADETAPVPAPADDDAPAARRIEPDEPHDPPLE